MDAFVASFFAPSVSDLLAAFVEDIRRSDGRERANIAASIRSDGYKDEVAVVAGLNIPLTILHGAEEQLVNGAYLAAIDTPTLWRGQVLPGAGHAPHWEVQCAGGCLPRRLPRYHVRRTVGGGASINRQQQFEQNYAHHRPESARLPP